MDASIVFSGETAERRSGPADHTGASVGEAEVETARNLSSPPDHPLVTRLRQRRLIAFLRDQGFRDSYNEVTNKTRAHMSLGHLRGLVKRGWWVEAVEYLDRYLRLPPPNSPKSYRAKVLHKFLWIHHRLAVGVVKKAMPRNYLQLNNDRSVSHAVLRLRSICFPILTDHEVRANINWARVRDRGSIIVSRLARSTPELRGCIALPATSIKPHHVLPIASGLWSRRRYVKKEQTERPEAIVRALKSQQIMVPRIGSNEEAQELLADLLDESLRYGVQLNTYGLNGQIQPGRNEGGKIYRTLVDAGTNQHKVEAGCHTNTDRQDLDERRNNLLPDLKRQRLTGAFGEASPVVSGPGAAVNLGAKLSGLSPVEETAGP